MIRRIESRSEAEGCARLMACSEPWITLGRSFETSLRLIEDPARESYIALGETAAEPLGLLMINMQGPFSGYIQTVLVHPEARGGGLGTRLVRFAEARILRESPNVFLCVSSFNPGARRLYERLGYRLIGELDDFMVHGHSEFLMRKTTGPWATFGPGTATHPKGMPE
jgi:ribosomal protein S18 acetylase RimI-like enzyme